MAKATPQYSKSKSNLGKIVSWKSRACVGRDEQGNQVWRVLVIPVDDPRLDGLTPTKRDKTVQLISDNWEKEQRELYEKTKAKSDRANISFSDFVENHWWPDHVMNGKHTPQSVAFYKYMSNDIVEYFGNKKLKRIDEESVIRYINYLNNDAISKSGEKYSDATVVRHYQTLRNIIRYALSIRYIQEDPCERIRPNQKPHMEKKGIDFLSPDDAKRFMKCLHQETIDAKTKLDAEIDLAERDKLEDRYYQKLFWETFLTVLIRTGLRRGEALGLQWRDLDTEKMILKVERNVTVDTKSKNDTKYNLGATKGKDSREVYISDSLKNMLLNLKEAQEERFSTKIFGTEFIFSNHSDRNQPIYPTEPTRYVSRFIKRNDLPNVSPHDLRHTAATLALESGADIKQVQELLGHKDPETTMQFYAGVTEEGKRRTVEGIEKILEG